MALSVDKSGQYQLDYSSFKGVVSDAPMYSLSEGEFPQLDGVIIKENKLCSVAWDVPAPIFNTSDIWGSLPPGVTQPIIQTYFYIYGVLYLIDTYMNIYVLAPAQSITEQSSTRQQFFWCASYTQPTSSDFDFAPEDTPIIPPIKPPTPPPPAPPVPSGPGTSGPPSGQYWIIGYKGVKVINGTAYIAGMQFPSSTYPDVVPYAALFAFNPLWAAPQLICISIYATGLFVGELDGHLVQANVVQPSDTPQFNYTKFSWSATSQFNQWDASQNYGAGYNALPSIEDIITGFINIANIGYVFRTQGCTQVTPISSGEQPFDFSNLTESTFGLGLVYPNSLDLWGDRACFVSDSEIYLATSQGFQPIGAAAKNAIYADINQFIGGYNLFYPYTQSVYGLISPFGANQQAYFNTTEDNGVFALNQSPGLFYHIIILANNPGYVANALPEDTIIYPDSMAAIVWSCNLATQSWTRHFIPLIGTGDVAAEQILPIPIYDYLNLNGSKLSNVNPVGRYPGLLVNNIPTLGSSLMAMSVNDIGSVDQNYNSILPLAPTTALNIVCKQELMGVHQEPTLRGVMVRAVGFGTISIYINNMYYGQVDINSATEQDYLCSAGVVTPIDGVGVQITLSTLATNNVTPIAATTFDGYITKIYAEGSVNQAPIF